MSNQHDICRADLAAFLTEMGNNLKKEGWSLQALAKSWFEGSQEHDVLKSFGINVDVYGDQLLAVKNQLCQKCLLKEVITGISIENHKGDGEVQKPTPGEEKKI